MRMDEVLQQLQQIGTCEEETERREMLAALSDVITEDYNAAAEVVADRDRLSADNEKLREANMKLFLRVGDHDKGDPGGQHTEKLKFENLFDEKGGLK